MRATRVLTRVHVLPQGPAAWSRCRSTLAAPLQRTDVDSLGQQGLGQERDVDWDSAKPFHEVPGPKPLPLVGNMWRFIVGK